MKAKILFLISVSLVLIGPVWLIVRSPRNNNDTGQKKIEVAASFYPLAFFAQEIGGNRAKVINITPSGAEPHDYEPTPKDLLSVYRSSVFILNGGGIDPWAQKIVPELKARGVIVVNMSEIIKMRQEIPGEPSTADPHIWLSPTLAEEEVFAISRSLIKADIQGKLDYEENRDRVVNELKAVDGEYRSGLSSCRQKDFVTTHAAFGYLAERYHLSQVSITGLSPDAEPSPQKLSEIVKIIREKRIKYILFETLVSPKLAQTLAYETGIKTLTLNPLEGLTWAQKANSVDYFSVMRDNLKVLKTAMECS
ncbi:MAG: zinc ABC transporter substrate-binding protein [Patescibacteria group bacterium]|nr:zinc ABC transporter substrate-binding protein [Patescibacteria group bacterium]